MNKKGQIFDQFGSLAIGVATLCIVLIVAFLIMAQAKTNMQADAKQICDNTSATYYTGNDSCQIDGTVMGHSNSWNSTGKLQIATSTIPGWISIIIITAIGAALIGMVAMFRR